MTADSDRSAPDLNLEREDFAHALEDAVAGGLSALCIQLEAASSVLGKHDVHRGLELISQAHTIAADALTDTRTLDRTLRGGPTDLTGQLALLVADLDIRTDTPLPPLSAAATVALVGATRTVLTNTVTRASTHPVQLRLHHDLHHVCVAITGGMNAGTDGRLNPAVLDRLLDGHQLTSVRERLLLVGGTLDVEFHLRLWTITARVPR